jgi:5'-nucleotidase
MSLMRSSLQPLFVETRLTGGAITDGIVINATTGFPVYTDVVGAGVNAALNGNKQLPGETLVSAKCQTAVSVFAIDYDAPSSVASPIQSRLGKLWGKASIH